MKDFIYFLIGGLVDAIYYMTVYFKLVLQFESFINLCLVFLLMKHWKFKSEL